MGLVDTLKSAKKVVEERMLPAPVVFHHVPKCGGTSVGRALRWHYILSQDTVLPEASFRAFEAFTGRNDRMQMLTDVLDLREQMMLYQLFRGIRCFSGHVRFSNIAFEIFSPEYRFITILREPVARFISHFFWDYGRTDKYAYIEEGFAEFLETPRAKEFGATYSRFFCGLPKETDFSSDKAIDAAIHNLKRMDIVGRLDDLPTFEKELKNKLGSRIRIGHENKMRQPNEIKSQTVTPELLEKAKVLCTPDILIWQAMFE